MAWLKSERSKALAEFREQSHDWIEVNYLTGMTDEENDRARAFKQLEDDGFVELLSVRNHLEQGGALYESDGRRITSTRSYRITASGDRASRSLFLRLLANVASNIPTIVVAVLSALLIDWVLDYFGSQGSAINRKE